jgi:hypothetical protein
VRRLSPRTVTLLLAALAATAVAAVLLDLWAMGELHLAIVGPAAVVLLMFLGWPFFLGWRPFARPLRVCTVCGAQWSPRQEGISYCPACSGADG